MIDGIRAKRQRRMGVGSERLFELLRYRRGVPEDGVAAQALDDVLGRRVSVS